MIDKALEALEGKELDGRTVHAERSKPREERPLGSGRRPSRGGRRVERRPRGPPSDTMIYFGNLPYSMTSEDLAAMVREFSVTSCNVVTRANGSSKGFGFVHAANNAEQQRIIAEMQNATCDGRTLWVRAATSEGPYGPGDEGDEAEH